MPTPEYLHDLHDRYRNISGLDRRRLTPDQQRSLRYFWVDTSQHGDEPTVGSGDRVYTWIQHAQAIDRFIEQHGLVPRRNSRRPDSSPSAGDRSLAVWLEDQRRPGARDRQCDYQRERIRAFPGLDSRGRNDRWCDTLATYGTFLEVHQRVPATRADTAAERALALWATNQRRLFRNGGLQPDRRAALEQLPIWSWGSALPGN